MYGLCGEYNVWIGTIIKYRPPTFYAVTALLFFIVSEMEGRLLQLRSITMRVGYKVRQCLQHL